MRCLVRASSDTSLLDALDVEIAVGDLDERTLARRARRGLPLRAPLRRAGVGLGDRPRRSRRPTSQGTRNLLDGLRRRVGAALRPLQHHRRLRLSGRRGDRRDAPRRRGFATGTRRPSSTPRREVRRVEREHGAGRRDPAPGDRLRTAARPTSSARSRARSAARNMLLVDRGRAVAGLCYVENLIDAALLALRHDAAPGQAFNVSDGLDVTWREFTDGLAEGLGCPQVRWSMPYWMAQRHRLLARARLPAAARRTTGLTRAAAALAPGRAGARAATRTSATARRARCSAGSRASTMRPASRRRSPGSGTSISRSDKRDARRTRGCPRRALGRNLMRSAGSRVSNPENRCLWGSPPKRAKCACSRRNVA